MTFNFKVFIRTFLSLMVKVCLITGWAYLIVALAIALFPTPGLETELMVPLWVVLGQVFLATGLLYLWVGERIKRF